MARTINEIVKELNEVRALYNSLTMNIGQDYAHIRHTNDNSLILAINKKTDSLLKVEAQLKALEQELATHQN